MLHIYNTLTKKKEPFTPLQDNHVRLYACGLTVYDHAHIGHARTVTAFDAIVRYLRYRGYNVLFVRNITDVDDKIIKRAHENHEPIDELVNRFITLMHHDFDRLGNLRPDIEPRATESMDDIINMINTLIEKNYAYTTPSGDVYYRVTRFKTYGKLSGQNTDNLRSGVRISPQEDKEDALDFALWKSAKPEEPFWDSPWGRGRPGWHIECSAMSIKHLGETFDIHGGGSDLAFPHHENEIAQSEAATGKPFARYWMHTGMIRINQEKMSKSLNNFFTIDDVLKTYPAEIIRLFLLSGHYRNEIDYSDTNLQKAKASLTRFYTALRNLPEAKVSQDNTYTKRFIQMMDDDFNTPEALAILFDLAHEINRLRDDNKLELAASLGAILKSLGAVLGILQENPETFLQGDVSLDNERIEALIAERNAARQAKNWAESDRIRDLLADEGIVLEDASGKTTWRRDF